VVERAVVAEGRLRSLRASKERLVDQRDRATDRADEQRKRAEDFKKKYRRVVSSRSWRLMAPFRVLGRLGRKLLGRG
jgi:hypothetical protein